MNGPSPQTRALFDDLRAIDEPSPSQVDHAWRRFAVRTQQKRRRRVGLWFGLAAAAAAIVLLLPALRSEMVVRDEAPHRSEAPAHANPRTKGQARSAAPAVGPPTSRLPRPEVIDAPEPLPEVVRDSSVGPASRPRHRSKVSPETVPTPDPIEPAAPSTLAAELEVLDDAEQALLEGELDRVERLLRAHREQFPEGVLTRERRKLERDLRARINSKGL